MTGPLLTPLPLRPGDRVAVVSPSWGGAGLFPRRFERALTALRTATGLVPVVMPHARESLDWRSATAEDRAADLTAAFTDPAIRGVICAIGGDHAAQVLPLLDLDALRADPKPLIGYSDITVLNHALYAAGLSSFYGPALLPQFGEYPAPDPYTVEHFRRVVMGDGAGPAGPVPASGDMVEEYLDWGAEETRPRERRPAPPRLLLRPGTGGGPLLAGCLPSALQLLGTPWQPDYRGHVLVLDVPDGGYGVADADRDLTQLRNAGLLARLGGLAIGRLRLSSEEEDRRVHEVVLRAVRDYDYPVLANIECGHTDPMATLPLGADCVLSGTRLLLRPPVTAPPAPGA
ncbi:S66 family peptidase [Streptomyces spectabilis]|uniref:Muramoyltetrapeptide carboxypeptidase n=1 Tax=Streptomyces spectabilis TaxID=68270 RepID=A0A7W8B4V0_STRST|nr:S66 peptidase family protein [Streptomyces spectabilis]MBB5108907.1 muramoyltetrapeptide carboxypeptidase [Streptomyces spectabilis]MCI3899799.1 LD-carboxypeptidase [Streptomyces spectabilis]GGV42855.1 LD-carboxypeptidase [Streptomyces spectabilis]